jgi:cobalamin biosynthesis Mg chelatase CobN
MEKAMQDKVASGAFQNASGSTSSSSGSSKSIYVYVLIALLILVAIGYMRRKKATETK